MQRLAKAVRQGESGRPAASALAPGTVRRQGRGRVASAAARHASSGRQRRVVVKVHIAGAGKSGARAFAKHLAYIHRPGTGRDGGQGTLYDRDRDIETAQAFNQRARKDVRQFRLIVAPEDALQMKDLTRFTRAFMDRVEKDLGRQLDWIAVNHHDTARPHVHVVVRGGHGRAGSLVIDRAYLTEGLRLRAEAEVTRELGQRRLREIAASRSQAADRDAFTSLDAELKTLSVEGRIDLGCEPGVLERFDRQVKARRLARLARLGLASHIAGPRWQLAAGWEETLKAMSRRADLLRSFARQAGRRPDLENLRDFAQAPEKVSQITGRLAAMVPGDELRNTRQLLVEGLDGHSWTAEIAPAQAGELPEIGGVISLTRTLPDPDPRDRVIARIASLRDGLYSEPLHTAEDPGSSPAYRQALGLRLADLCRKGLIDRPQNGVWHIPPGFAHRTRLAEIRRVRLALTVNSWLPIEQLIEREALTWLDKIADADIAGFGAGFGAEVRAARIARRAWAGARGIDLASAERLQAAEFQAALSQEADRSGKDPRMLPGRDTFRGVYTRDIDLAGGRFSVIENDGQLALARWSARRAAWLGREVAIQARGRSLQWQLSRERGRGR